MSLINQMLKDLERRQAHRPEGLVAPPGPVRAVDQPPRRMVHPAWWLVLILLLAVAVMAGALWRRGATSPPKSVVSEPVPLAAPSPRPTPGATPVSVAAPSAVEAADHGREPAPSSTATPSGTLTKPHKERTAEVPAPAKPGHAVAAPKPDAPSIPSPGTRVDGGAAAGISLTKDQPIAKPLALPADTGTEAASRVDKRVRALSPREQAEKAYRQALGLIQQGRLTEGIQGLEAALHDDPGHSQARMALVGLLVDSKRYDEAEARLKEGLALDPAQPQAAMILARLQVQRGDVEAGIRTLQATLPAAGPRSDYHAFLAALLQRVGRHQEAIEQYTEALSQSPAAGVWWMGLGLSLEAVGKTPEAKSAFTKALAADNLSQDLRTFVAQRLHRLDIVPGR